MTGINPIASNGLVDPESPCALAPFAPGAKNGTFFGVFPYVCPEPVVETHSDFTSNWRKASLTSFSMFCRRGSGRRRKTPGGYTATGHRAGQLGRKSWGCAPLCRQRRGLKYPAAPTTSLISLSLIVISLISLIIIIIVVVVVVVASSNCGARSHSSSSSSSSSRGAVRSRTRLALHVGHVPLRCGKRLFRALVYTKIDDFTKTGSGQTQEKLSKKRRLPQGARLRSCRAAEHRCPPSRGRTTPTSRCCRWDERVRRQMLLLSLANLPLTRC
eukprot:COSAG06_NODE_4580_length_4128_cov_5.816580_2_plen_272_part_00